MKQVLWYRNNFSLPVLDSSCGNGSFVVDDALYFEYSHKLHELLEIAERLVRIAERQGMRV